MPSTECSRAWRIQPQRQQQEQRAAEKLPSFQRQPLQGNTDTAVDGNIYARRGIEDELMCSCWVVPFLQKIEISKLRLSGAETDFVRREKFVTRDEKQLACSYEYECDDAVLYTRYNETQTRSGNRPQEQVRLVSESLGFCGSTASFVSTDNLEGTREEDDHGYPDLIDTWVSALRSW